MNKQEATYWKRFIIKTIEEKLSTIKTSDEDAIRISQFAEQHMQLITGQQMLPQRVFREFLELFAHIPEIQADIEHAQEIINDYLENLPVECSRQDVEQMFDGLMWDDDYMWLPSLTIDEEGYGQLDIEVDEDGYAHFIEE